jgi:alpha-L-rhamnosidase
MMKMENSEARKLLIEAKWIWPEHRLYDLHNSYAHFRKDFAMHVKPDIAMLYITADESYRLWINGKYITRGPARGYQSHWPYDQVDVAAFLIPGWNIIAVEVYNPGVSTYKYLSQGSAGFICAGDFGEVTILSDATWLSRYDKAHKRDTALYSRQLNFQEHVDAREDNRAWIDSPEPPTRSREGWLTPEESVFGSMPWHSLEERGIPQLRELPRTPGKIVSRASGNLAADYRQWRNIVQGLHQAFENLPWLPENNGRLEHGSSQITFSPAGKGRFSAAVLDMGETVVGPAIVKVQGGKAGTILDLFFCEALNHDISPVIPFPALCEASMANRLILAEGNTNFDFYQILGFRYITLVAEESVEPLSIELQVIDTGYPYTLVGKFQCSDDNFNKIWSICRRTEQVCSLDAYVDTPWREQAQWWGDARIQFWNTMAMDGDTRLLKRGIRSLAGQKVPNGLTYGHAPTMAHICILPDFSLVWLITIFDYYYQTKDLTLFEEQLPRIREVLSYFRNEAPRQKGLLANDPRYWLFLDWSTIEKSGAPVLYNMWYILALRTFTQLLDLSGNSRESQAAAEEALEIQQNLERMAFDPEKGLFCDGLDTTGQPSSKYSVQSQVFAMVLGLKPEYHSTMIEQRVLPFLRGEQLDEAIPSAFWTSYVLTIARQKGYCQEALDFIRRMWTPMIPLGTTLEVFDSDTPFTTKVEAFVTRRGFTSVSHAWSAHPLFHLMNILGGVVQETAGWEQIVFNPYFAPELDRVMVTTPSPQGLIESSWQRQDGGIAVRLKLPKGVTARIEIPGHQAVIQEGFEKVI